MQYYVGFDIGGSSIKYGLLDENGEISKKDHFKTPSDKDQVLDKMAEVVSAFTKDYKVKAIGLSVPGVVEENGFLTTAGAISCLYGINIKEEIEKRTGLFVHAENDANAASIAEKWGGAAQGIANYISLVIGTGIGGCLVVNHEIYRGAHARSGEFGWMLLDDNQDDLNSSTMNFQAATIIGLLRIYNLKSGEKISDARTIYERAEKGEYLAQTVLTKFYRKLAQGILNVVVAFDPSVVVIGGGISANPTFLKDLQLAYKQLQNEHGALVDMDIPQIVPAKFLNDAGIIGAVYCVKVALSKEVK
ncbi:ROK family protein [Tetragenococcus koreensis]|uniref:Transcriptional regulator / sugar kinase NagC n=1 Tax=Tetragenococcus koreensis TaxID=290335 RepID=A0AAN4UD69_9ENTE|nr:ROK family protein [Tetragenococcus koreensis]GEQ50338.1 transcriptional regulator / sugar kinase NagC [Tetragenococcus koreensis]GEQ52824.1 transcriptional regulator / sugar kinase NagC [Tetragenococcus koreensis]GEQ55314.1 transcriptional regulator / sugar kinase NagC [Tetragenococcus koreensis]GEQ57795.1 transcriptional regulator / sugar kinase NagC [Tetragenococcus koreensis]GEQ60324.1 transcriptional regulator / sugar kinase NagC [Tetragenococcus koreensis]